MKSFFLTLFCLSISLSFFSQKLENPIDSYEKNLFIKLNEKLVKKRIENLFFLDDKEKNIPEKEEVKVIVVDSLRPYYLETVSMKEDTFINKFVFNKKNDLIKFSEKKLGVRMKGKFKYDYDSVGSILREFRMDGTGKLISFKEHSREANEMNTSIYDEKGHLLVKEKMVYDPINKIYLIQSISSEKRIEFQKKVFLNELGLITKYEHIKYPENLITREVNKYDDKGNKTEILITDEKGKPFKKILFKYNENGLVIRRTTFDPINKRNQISKFEYEFYVISSE